MNTEGALCECGCGLPAPIAPRTHTAFGHVKGQPMRFRRGHGGGKQQGVPFAEMFGRYVVCHGDPDACWPWFGPGRKYGSTRYNGRKMDAHVAAYRLFKGEIPAGLLVRHTCDQRRCCNPAHLIVGTYADNSADMVARNRQLRGERHNMAILTADDVRAIRASYTAAHGEQAQLAEQYGVSRANINHILKRRLWKHV